MNDQLRTTELDIRGQMCPSTLLITLREVNRFREPLQRGEMRLRVRTDNRNATVTIPQAVRNMGYRVEVLKEAGGFLIFIEAGEG